MLVNCDLGTIDDVLNALKKLHNIIELHLLFGVYDIVVKIEAESQPKLREMIVGTIRHLNHVRSTQTLIVKT